MKYIGLIKWFDTEKGFGKLGTPDDGEIFIHQNNFAVRPEKLLIASSLIFETKKDNRGVTAINAQTPTTYLDFQFILSYLKRNPSILIEQTFTGKSKWGNQYKRKELRPHNLIDYSLHHLLRNKPATEIFEFFKKYFDEQYPKQGSEFATKYLTITEEKIKGINLKLNGFLLEEFERKNPKKRGDDILTSPFFPNDYANIFLIQTLFAYYLDKFNVKFLFEVWKNKTYLVKQYHSAWNGVRQDGHFTANELVYIGQVYTGILAESVKNLDQLAVVINSFTTQMTDAKRLEIINKAADGMQENYDDLVQFNSRNIGISLQRSRDEHDINVVKQLYGIQ